MEDLENRINNISKRKNLIENETNNNYINCNIARQYKDKQNEKSIDSLNHQYKSEISKNYNFNDLNSSPYSYRIEQNNSANKIINISNTKDDNNKNMKRNENEEKGKLEEIHNRNIKLRNFLKQIKSENKNLLDKNFNGILNDFSLFNN